MNNYNEKETILMLQDPSTQQKAFERIVKAYSEQLYWQIRRMVEVRNEDVVQPAELQFGAAELHLCPFAAVNHEQLLADVKHLRGRLMAGSGQGRTASQDVYVEFFHSYDSNWVFRMSPVSAYAICILKALRSDIGVWQDFPSESFR
jgi:hypothetical protein